MTTLYKTATGEIIMSCDHVMDVDGVDQILKQNPGCSAIDECVPYGTHYIDKGRGIAKPARPEQPSTFDYRIKQWVPVQLAYDIHRRRAYPPLADFADAWVKQDEAALEAYRQKCLDVKAQYPKPR